MAESVVTQTGVDELRALYAALPDRVNAVSLRIARGVANAMVVDARRRLQNPKPPTKGETERTGATAEMITIREDAGGKQLMVDSKSPSKYPANLVIWIEYGTIRQPARPYMWPAAEAQRDAYARDYAAAMNALAKELSS